MNIPKIKVLNDPAGVAQYAAEQIVRLAARCIDVNGKFSIALSGGSTPKRLYELLATDPFREQIDWTKVHLFFGDERTVPPEDAESNFGMAKKALLSRVPIPGDNIYRMRGEIDPELAAREYGKMLKEQFGDDGGLDLVLLGLGDDGHTLSLFPHTPALNETKHRCVANPVEKLHTIRITLTAPFVNRAGQAWILATGEGKKARVQEVLEVAADPQRLPIQLIAPKTGELLWILDIAAAGMDA